MNARGRVFVLFRSGLGLVFLAAFLSLAAQLRDLAGSRGLLPWADFLARLHQGGSGGSGRFLSFPTLFLWIRGDAALTIVPLLGAAISILMVLGIGGRTAAFFLSFLSLSCATPARGLFFFHWGNPLPECSFLALLFSGRGPPLLLLPGP